VLVPFNIACGQCHFCQQGLFGNCHESNAQATAVGAIFGYSHTAGGYDGGQAQFVRVPYADVGPTLIPDWMDPDDAVLLTDVVPTGYQAAEMGGIQKGDTVVVFGAGPVGIMAARCAWLFGAGRVIVIDHLHYRLDFARRYGPPEVYDFREIDDMAVFIKKQTDSLGADVCIDAVGRGRLGQRAHTLFGKKIPLEAGTPSRSLGDQLGQEGGIVSVWASTGPRATCPHRQRGEQGHHHPRQPGLGEALLPRLIEQVREGGSTPRR
jgi:threonine dehydrogenase-like Zn-dependent dehydrogenase